MTETSPQQQPRQNPPWNQLFEAHITSLSAHLDLLTSFTDHLAITHSPPLQISLRAMQTRAAHVLSDARKCRELSLQPPGAKSTLPVYIPFVSHSQSSIPSPHPHSTQQPLPTRAKRPPEPLPLLDASSWANTSKRRRVVTPTPPAPTVGPSERGGRCEDISHIVAASLEARRQRRLEDSGVVPKKARKRKRRSSVMSATCETLDDGTVALPELFAVGKGDARAGEDERMDGMAAQRELEWMNYVARNYVARKAVKRARLEGGFPNVRR